MARELELTWSGVFWYKATIDLDKPGLAGLSIDDFPLGTQDLSERVQELLSNLEQEGALWQVDAVEISGATYHDRAPGDTTPAKRDTSGTSREAHSPDNSPDNSR